MTTLARARARACILENRHARSAPAVRSLERGISLESMADTSTYVTDFVKRVSNLPMFGRSPCTLPCFPGGSSSRLSPRERQRPLAREQHPAGPIERIRRLRTLGTAVLRERAAGEMFLFSACESCRGRVRAACSFLEKRLARIPPLKRPCATRGKSAARLSGFLQSRRARARARTAEHAGNGRNRARRFSSRPRRGK